METHPNPTVKTTIILDKNLLEEIDHYNPFPTRKDFLNEACKTYLQQLRKKLIDEELAQACADAADEDAIVDEEWESINLESWK
jgi:hypothetical protein